jgi:uncharacterized protein YwgA
MDAYQLAKLVEWAGTLHTRKRLQKVVYLLKAADCPLNVDYTLHYYGPYSADIARLTDAMVQADLLREEESPNAMTGRSFSYTLSDTARSRLLAGIQDPSLEPSRLRLQEFENLARRLLKEPNLQKLEFAATIAYFRKQLQAEPWQAAREAAAKFKQQESDSREMRDAEEFARQVLEPEDSD